MLSNVDDTTFEEKVLKAKGLHIVDFWAEWCGPCKALKPLFSQVAEGYQGTDVTFHGFDIDDNPLTPSKYGIMTIPTLLVFENGTKKEGHVGGFASAEDLKTWVESVRG